MADLKALIEILKGEKDACEAQIAELDARLKEQEKLVEVASATASELEAKLDIALKNIEAAPKARANISSLEAENTELKANLQEALALVGDYEPCDTCGKVTLGGVMKELKALKDAVNNSPAEVGEPILLNKKGVKYADNTPKARSAHANFVGVIFDKKAVAEFFAKKPSPAAIIKTPALCVDGKPNNELIDALYADWCAIGYIVKEDGSPVE